MFELKPCPFCGAVNPEKWQKDKRKNRCELVKYNGVWSVVCCGCGGGTANYNKPEQAIEAWNRRVNDG